jgi:hypothetical protein
MLEFEVLGARVQLEASRSSREGVGRTSLGDRPGVEPGEGHEVLGVRAALLDDAKILSLVSGRDAEGEDDGAAIYRLQVADVLLAASRGPVDVHAGVGVDVKGADSVERRQLRLGEGATVQRAL